MIFTFLTVCFFLQSFTPEVIEHAQAGAAAQQAGHYDIAIKEFRKVVELQPNSASGHANLGDACFQNGEYEAAIPELEEALRLNPKLMGTHQMLGVALLVEGNATAALPHLEQTHTPELLGLAYLETGKLGSAIMALHAALERQPNDPDLLYYFGRATALAADKTQRQLSTLYPQWAGAKDAEQKLRRDVVTLQGELAKTPNDPELLYDFHEAAALESRKAFDQILERNAGSARAHQVMAERDVEDKRFGDAKREYAEALRLKPYTSGVHLAFGNVLASQGDWTAAITQFQLEAQMRPQDAAALYRLGSALLREGQARQAAAAFAQVDKLRPNTPEVLLALGNASMAASDFIDAKQSWQKLLTIDQESELAAQAHMGLSTLFRSAGRAAEADSELAAYQKLTTQGKH